MSGTRDEEVHAAAILAAINAALGAAGDAYDVDDVPDPVPDTLVTVYLGWRVGGNRRAGRIADQGWRFTTRYEADSVGNARLLKTRVDQALRDVRLQVGLDHTTPVQHDAGEVIGEEDGRYTGADDWTYVL